MSKILIGGVFVKDKIVLIKMVIATTFLIISTYLYAGDLIPADGITPALGQIIKMGATHQVNELSKRRRLTTFFVNEQSPFYGVQLNYVNVRRGNLTFLNRDLVRYDWLPIVFGRVYDSGSQSGDDFGLGWKLSVVEIITKQKSKLLYYDASGSEYFLEVDGSAVYSQNPQLTGIQQGSYEDDVVRLPVGNLVKIFRRIGNAYYLKEVQDRHNRNLKILYQGTHVKRIESSNGRYVDIRRGKAGRITGAQDDAGREVTYEYNDFKQLVAVTYVGGGKWEISYDDQGLLQQIIDPRKLPVLTAEYDEIGRTSAVRVLHNEMTYDYNAGRTIVHNTLNQSAVFYHHGSGLTQSSRDFAGDVTAISFDKDLRPIKLTYNGNLIAELMYGDSDNLVTIKHIIEGQEVVSTFSYDAADYLTRITNNGELDTEYNYDDDGNILSVLDHGDIRGYEYGTNGNMRKITVNDESLQLMTNKYGLLAGFANDKQVVRIHYDELDHVRKIHFKDDEGEFENSYTYGSEGLRKGGSYVPSPDVKIGGGWNYDAVGNLIGFTLTDPEGNQASQVYHIGTNNELLGVDNDTAPNGEMTYDALGRPVKTQFGESETAYAYDTVGRLSAVWFEGKQILKADYGPMDVDSATAADGRTAWTAVDEPIASAVFGSLEAIVYARLQGTPYGPIRFMPDMARFVLAEPLVTAPDALVVAGFKRRALPIFEPSTNSVTGEISSNRANPAPMGYDKPSNGLFLPAEFSSLNCYYCYPWITSGLYGNTYMNVSQQSGQPVVVAVGANGGDYNCYQVFLYYDPFGYQYYYYADAFHYTTDFGDGSEATYSSYSPYGYNFLHNYASSGSYTVENYSWCGGACGIAALQVLTQNVNVTQSSCEPNQMAGYNFHSGLISRPSLVQSRYVFSNYPANKFSFAIYPRNDEELVPNNKKPGISTSANAWDKTDSMCGVSYTNEIDFQWKAPGMHNIRFEYDENLPYCGLELNGGAPSGGHDLVQIRCVDTESGTPPDRLTTAHEIGHVLGLQHRPDDTSDLMYGGGVNIRNIFAYHIKALIVHYF